MRQLSLLNDDDAVLAGVMPAVRAAMRRAAGAPDSDGRKVLVDKINRIAGQAEIRLTGGNGKGISKDVLDKWLSPSDVGHPPGINALMAFCKATGDPGPLRVMLQALGLDVMTDEDRKFRDFGRAEFELRAARRKKRLLEESL